MLSHSNYRLCGVAAGAPADERPEAGGPTLRSERARSTKLSGEDFAASCNVAHSFKSNG